ncbi:hypothetical protein AB4Y45_44865 [Paraburkholderia sp. EG287A]|uniref:hypothetical protein n=1 Tax=unclassified Paraburkholderia TaxID=2615204 RepID=UPI0034D26A28
MSDQASHLQRTVTVSGLEHAGWAQASRWPDSILVGDVTHYQLCEDCCSRHPVMAMPRRAFDIAFMHQGRKRNGSRLPAGQLCCHVWQWKQHKPREGEFIQDAEHVAEVR